MNRHFVGAALAATLSVASAAELTPEQDARYRQLIGELRCLVCQNQSIAESNAPLAADLRDEVRAQIAAGKTDAEVGEFVTARYSDFVLYRPPFKARTWLLWLGPFALLALVGLVAAVFIRRSRRAAAVPTPADAAAVQRLLEDEQRR